MIRRSVTGQFKKRLTPKEISESVLSPVKMETVIVSGIF